MQIELCSFSISREQAENLLRSALQSSN